jgi:hypothetical protein
MNHNVRRQVLALISLLILLSIFIPGCSSHAKDISVDLVFSEPPVLNKPVILTETFTLRKDFHSEVAENITAHIKLPDGFVKVDGETEWNGTLSRGETKTLSATVKSTRTGSFQIEANAVWLVVNPPGSGGGKTIFVTVSENGATISDHVPTAPGTLTVTASTNTSNPYNAPKSSIHSPTSPLPTPTVSISQASADSK